MFNKFSESILFPTLIRIEPNLIIAKFELMKILPAKYIVESALRRNVLNPQMPVVETSSGTFALGLGIVCAELGIPFYIIGDRAIDSVLENRLVQLGGEVQILSESFALNNPQTLRLNALKEYLTDHPKAYWTQQYDNIENQHAYTPFAHYLLEKIGQDFTLVGAVGSGGSTCGTIGKLRESSSAIRLVGVDTFGSILFGLKNQKRILRGLGNSVMPKNLYHYYFDEIHWVNANDAFFYTRKLHFENGLFCGPTTGATYQVAKYIADNNPYETVVFISADTGYRYQHTVYNTLWLNENNLRNTITEKPLKLSHPMYANENMQWSYFKWDRQYYSSVMSNHP